MLLKVYSIFDSKVEAFEKPLFVRTRGEALRMFSDLAKDKDHYFAQHPEDYTLFELGDYCTDSAAFSLFDTPHSLGLLLEFKES